MRLERRFEAPSPFARTIGLAGGAVLALLLGAVLILAFGYSPLVAYGALLRGMAGSPRAIAATVNNAVPIGLCAAGIALAARAGLWNIGAEGQLYMGAVAATGLGLALPAHTPAALAVASVLVAGLGAGAAWAALAALPKAWLGVNEILSTLMLNYVAILWVGYLVGGPWADPLTVSFPYSPPLPDAARIGTIGGGLHASLTLLVAALVGLQAIGHGSRFGYELRVIGASPRAARYAGIAIKPLVVAALAGAGASAGLAGAIQVAAATGRLQSGLSPGYGFMAILVAWLAGGRPAGILLGALLYAGLLNGGFSLQMAHIPPAVATILQALILLCILSGSALVRYRLRFDRRQVA